MKHPRSHISSLPFSSAKMKILKKRFIRGFLKCIFSNVGLCILVTGYVVAGAFLFQYLEGHFEMQKYKLIHESALHVQVNLEKLRARILNFASSCENCHSENATTLISGWLHEYVMVIIQKKNETNGEYVGQKFENSTDVLRDWSLPSAILFTTTILTTIGYGNVTPKTELGQLGVMMYAVCAIPLMSMFLINVGTQLANGVRWIFAHLVVLVSKKWSTRVAPETEENKDESSFNDDVPVILIMIMGILYIIMGILYIIMGILYIIMGILYIIMGILYIIMGILYIIMGMLLFHFTEKWRLIQALYFTFISLSTIGFGDYVPSANARTLMDQMRMVMTTGYLFVGLALFAMCISLMTGVLKEYRRTIRSIMIKVIEKCKKIA